MALFGLNFESVERYLESYGRYIIRQAESELAVRSNTGSLAKSLDFTIFEIDGGYEIRWTAASYGEYIDKGVSGAIGKRYYYAIDGKRKRSPYSFVDKGPPIPILVDWIRSKGIQGRKPKGAKDSKGGQFITRKSLAFLMSRKIKNYGLKSISFYSKPISYSFKVFQQKLAESFAEDVEVILSQKL